MIKKSLFLLPILIIAFISSCDTKTEYPNRVVIGIPADVNTFNPLFAFSVDEGAITELLYLSLADFRWNEEIGELEAHPMLAKSWEWADDSSSITFYLRDDVMWSDGTSLTADDVVFSLDVYSDPVVNSRLYGIFEDLFTDEENHIDVEKSFIVKSNYELQMNFKPGSSPNLVDIVHPVIPKHIFQKYDRKDIETADANFNPVTSSPFVLKKWDRNQTITLSVNENSFLYNPDNINELIFKIVPDYTSRLTQLQKGEIDLMELISTEDVEEVKNADKVRITTIDGREYDYVAWNNIDPNVYKDGGGITPNKLFGSNEVRIALTHAINRKEILEEYLYNYGELAATPISPIFKSYVNPDIEQYDYNPEKARQILANEGWKDTNNNGVIDKNGNEFEFTLTFPGGNPLRDYAASIIKNNLKAVGIEIKLETLEIGAFIDKLGAKSMDAWMAAWYIPIPLEIKAFWYSDLQNTPLNFVSYQNLDADKIMDELVDNLPLNKKRELYFKFQEIIHKDQPVTFMYWFSNLVGINKKIKNIIISPLGAVTHCWEWSVVN
jgi:peptide/nickel transport system substrate-binding protein